MAHQSRRPANQAKAIIAASLITVGALAVGILLAFVVAPIGPKQAPSAQIVNAR